MKPIHDNLKAVPANGPESSSSMFQPHQTAMDIKQ